MTTEELRKRLERAKDLREVWFAALERWSTEDPSEGVDERLQLVEQCRQAYEEEAAKVVGFLIGYHWADER